MSIGPFITCRTSTLPGTGRAAVTVLLVVTDTPGANP